MNIEQVIAVIELFKNIQNVYFKKQIYFIIMYN